MSSTQTIFGGMYPPLITVCSAALRCECASIEHSSLYSFDDGTFESQDSVLDATYASRGSHGPLFTRNGSSDGDVVAFAEATYGVDEYGRTNTVPESVEIKYMPKEDWPKTSVNQALVESLYKQAKFRLGPSAQGVERTEASVGAVSETSPRVAVHSGVRSTNIADFPLMTTCGDKSHEAEVEERLDKATSHVTRVDVEGDDVGNAAISEFIPGHKYMIVAGNQKALTLEDDGQETFELMKDVLEVFEPSLNFELVDDGVYRSTNPDIDLVITKGGVQRNPLHNAKLMARDDLKHVVERQQALDRAAVRRVANWKPEGPVKFDINQSWNSTAEMALVLDVDVVTASAISNLRYKDGHPDGTVVSAANQTFDQKSYDEAMSMFSELGVPVITAHGTYSDLSYKNLSDLRTENGSIFDFERPVPPKALKPFGDVTIHCLKQSMLWLSRSRAMSERNDTEATLQRNHKFLDQLHGFDPSFQRLVLESCNPKDFKIYIDETNKITGSGKNLLSRLDSIEVNLVNCLNGSVADVVAKIMDKAGKDRGTLIKFHQWTKGLGEDRISGVSIGNKAPSNTYLYFATPPDILEADIDRVRSKLEEASHHPDAVRLVSSPDWKKVWELYKATAIDHLDALCPAFETMVDAGEIDITPGQWYGTEGHVGFGQWFDRSRAALMTGPLALHFDALPSL